MKKTLLLTLVAVVFGLGVSQAEAGYSRKYCCPKENCGSWRQCYVKPDRCEYECEPKCVEKCPQPACTVDKVIHNEEPCPAVPCCVRYVRVEEPALITKHVDISYTAECPTGCTPEQQAAGMLKAGQSIDY